ncbi:5-formyltetrahydrofolate cyclo-ligase [Forsythia ovata]|uniref:5-formyltetrahydrofolate cyclo-ligase n=1 Tax=Forsythia ovata TaxID=205694 RepID=A0ABD1TRA1_9LAMI
MYSLTGTGRVLEDRNEDDFESSTRSVSSKLTQEWLEEAKQMVASSPSRVCDWPFRLVVSPRFATTQGSLSTSSLDKRDYRSARRLWSEACDGRIRRAGKDSSDQKAPRLFFGVIDVLEVNQTLNGSLGSDVFVSWATEVEGIIATGKEACYYSHVDDVQNDNTGKYDAIQSIVLEAPWFKSCKGLCAYISCSALREVDTSKVLSEILKNGDQDDHSQVIKKLYVPRVEDKNNHMRMLNISRMNDLIANSMDKLEPACVDAEGNERKDGNSRPFPAAFRVKVMKFPPKTDDEDRHAPLSQPIPSPTNLPAISKRTFKNTATTANNAPATILDTQFLSPPKHLIESTHQRTLSSNTCSVTEAEVLSPPRKLVESAHRRSISFTTCSIERNLQKSNVDD